MARASHNGTAPHPLHHRLLAQLQHERSAYGHGSAAMLDERIGKSAGYIGRVLRGEISLQTEQLFKMLEALEVEPAAFFATVVGSDFSPKRFLNHWARRLKGSCAEPVLPISSQLRQALTRLAQGSSPDPRHASGPKGRTDHVPYCARKDRQLYRAAQQLKEAAFSGSDDGLKPTAELLTTAHDAYAVGNASGNALAHVLRLAASVERRHGRAGGALLFLQGALEAVEGPSHVDVELLVEAVYHLVPQEQWVAAQLMLDGAQHRAILLGAGPVMGQILLARGHLASAKSLPTEALIAYEASFGYLEPDAWPSHFLACQGAAQSHLANGDLFQAGRYLARAEAHHPTQRGPHWGRLQWTKADWTQAGAQTPTDLELALGLYDEALAAFDADRQPLDIVALRLQQAKILQALGALDRLRRTAAAALQVTGRLKKTPKVYNLLLQFATLTMTGELTESWLRQAVEALAIPRIGQGMT